MTRRRLIAAAVPAVAALLLPLVMEDPYWLHLAIMSAMYMMLAASIDVIYGYAGQLNLGQAAFAAIGAYTTALLMLRLNMTYWVAMPLSGLNAALFGLLLGIPTRRLRGAVPGDRHHGLQRDRAVAPAHLDRPDAGPHGASGRAFPGHRLLRVRGQGGLLLPDPRISPPDHLLRSSRGQLEGGKGLDSHQGRRNSGHGHGHRRRPVQGPGLRLRGLFRGGSPGAFIRSTSPSSHPTRSR